MSEFENQGGVATTDAAPSELESNEIFYHPETGEKISKNAYKKLLKGNIYCYCFMSLKLNNLSCIFVKIKGVPAKKEKKEKIAPVVNNEKKEKKKVEKEPEIVYTDNTPIGQFKEMESSNFPPTYQPKYVEAAWQSWWEQSKFYEPNVQKGNLSDDNTYPIHISLQQLLVY